jgi:hypothetical protein
LIQNLDILLFSKFDASALRLYLYFFKSNSRSIHTDDRRSEQAFHAARTTPPQQQSSNPSNSCPTGVKSNAATNPNALCDRLQAQLGGKTEAPAIRSRRSPNRNEIIEVKAIHLWKDAWTPDAKKVTHIQTTSNAYTSTTCSGLQPKYDRHILQKFDIKVTFELVKKTK